MKVAVSAVSDSLDAQIESRFGRCPYFVIVETATMNFETLPNPSQNAGSGAGIQAAQTVANKGVHTVLTGNVGPNAYQVLSAAGINVITNVFGTVKEAVEKFKSGQLQKITAPTTPLGFGMEGNYGVGSGRGGGRGMGLGRGMGKGRGRGMGMGRFAPSAPTVAPTTLITQTTQMSKEQEILMLENQMKSLQQQLDQIKKRLKELSTRE